MTTENGDTYHGTANGIEVLFHNDVKDHAVTLFPEPPMTVRLLQPAGQCVVDDGGVWGRDGVWLSGDGRTLVTTESSGSAQDLVFRDTRTCAQVGRLDVAGMQWHVDGRKLVLQAAADKHRSKRLALDGTYVYWSNNLGGAVMRAPKDGSAAPSIVSTAVEPWGIVVAGSYVYFTDQNATIQRAPTAR